AGSHALEGNPAASRSMLAAATRGGNLERHFARELTRRRVRAADLVLCMAAEHRPFVLSYDRGAANRTFLLASFAPVASQWDWLPTPPAAPGAPGRPHQPPPRGRASAPCRELATPPPPPSAPPPRRTRPAPSACTAWSCP